MQTSSDWTITYKNFCLVYSHDNVTLNRSAHIYSAILILLSAIIPMFCNNWAHVYLTGKKRTDTREALREEWVANFDMILTPYTEGYAPLVMECQICDEMCHNIIRRRDCSFTKGYFCRPCFENHHKLGQLHYPEVLKVNLDTIC